MSYTTLQLKTFSFKLIYCFKICFEIFFAECQKKITLGKEPLCRVLKKTLGKEPLYRVSKKHSAKAALPSARKITLGKPTGTRQRAGLRTNSNKRTVKIYTCFKENLRVILVPFKKNSVQASEVCLSYYIGQSQNKLCIGRIFWNMESVHDMI